jgi:RNA polymerase sigma-70 factor (ECF subfamily)
MDDTSDTLLSRLRQPAPQEQAWSRFVELYTPLLTAWARRTGCSAADADDLVQEALALLLRKLPHFRYDKNKTFRGWLRTVTMNCWRNLRRGSAGRRAGRTLNLDQLAAPEHEDPFWKSEDRQRLMGRALKIMRSEFQPRTWQACWQCVVDGKPPAQIGRELGMTIGAVYMAKSRVLSRLRQEMGELVD